MAISTYTELLTALENWSANTEHTNRLPEFIALCENRIWYGHGDESDPLHSEPLKISAMEATTDLTIDEQEVAHPTDFLYARRLYLDTIPKVDLTYMPPDRFWQSTQARLDTTGKPELYTNEGTNFVFAWSPDSTYTGKLLYYKKLTGLSPSNDSNWIITNAPAMYLYGSMLEYYLYLRNDTEIQKYALLFSGAVNSINAMDKALRHSGSDISARPDVTP